MIDSDSDDELLGISDREISWKHKNRVKFNIFTKGFIVNIHDAINFDIDLNIDANDIPSLNTMITNSYRYYQISKGENFNEGFSKSFNKNYIKTGSTYRCRLRGIGINQQVYNPWKKNHLFMKVKQFIDRADGWINCRLIDVDVYHRLLVDIIVLVPSGDINIKDYILEQMENEVHPMFYPYK